MYGFLITIHVIVCVLLVIIVLIQSGRGGGLVENFSSAESIFGTKTNAFLTRATAVFAILFIITCLSLAFISVQRSKSLMSGISQQQTETANLPAEEIAAESDEADAEVPFTAE